MEINNLIRSAFDGLLKEHGFWDTSPFASSRLPPVPPSGPFPWFELGLKEDANGFWVAQAGKELVGFALAWVRGSLWYLAHLFVLPNHQGHDIGRNLMDRVMEYAKDCGITNRALVTLAYDPVSISLYARYGIYPREPLYYMDVPCEKIAGRDAGSELKSERVETFQSARKILRMVDEKCVGFPREKNHEYLHSLPSVKRYLFSSGKDPVGYAYVAQNGRVGPVATVSGKFLIDIVQSALEYAAKEKAPSVSLTLAGSNEKLMKLAFSYGMKIRDNFLLMSSKPFPNFSNYVVYPTGAML